MSHHVSGALTMRTLLLAFLVAGGSLLTLPAAEAAVLDCFAYPPNQFPSCVVRETTGWAEHNATWTLTRAGCLLNTAPIQWIACTRGWTLP